MTKHKVKSWSHFYDAIKEGRKLHDLRKMDREYNVGDILVLQRYDNIKGNYTGEELEVEVTYITSNKTPCAFSSSALDRDYAILSLKLLEPQKNPSMGGPIINGQEIASGDSGPELFIPLDKDRRPKIMTKSVTPNPNAEYYQNNDRELHWEGVGEYRG